MFQDQLQNVPLSDILPAKCNLNDEFFTIVDKNSTSFELSSASSSEIKDSPISTGVKRKYFSKTEDELLIDAVLKFKQESWNDIAKFVPGKTPKQCRDRWANYLQPSLKFDPWKNSDDQLLVSLVNKYGTHWSKMKNYFPSRSTNSMKNRWNYLIKNHVKVLPIDNFIISTLTNISKFRNKSFDHRDFNLINFDSFNASSETQNANLKFYFLDNNMHENDDFLTKSTDFINEKRNNDGLIKNNNKLNDDIISFTPEELEW
mgnify:CR=1 FL=1